MRRPRGPVRASPGGYAEGPERPAEQGGRREGGSRFVYGLFGAGQAGTGVQRWGGGQGFRLCLTLSSSLFPPRPASVRDLFPDLPASASQPANPTEW